LFQGVDFFWEMKTGEKRWASIIVSMKMGATDEGERVRKGRWMNKKS
jgi:hypothetical protein